MLKKEIRNFLHCEFKCKDEDIIDKLFSIITEETGDRYDKGYDNGYDQGYLDGVNNREKLIFKDIKI